MVGGVALQYILIFIQVMDMDKAILGLLSHQAMEHRQATVLKGLIHTHRLDMASSNLKLMAMIQLVT